MGDDISVSLMRVSKVSKITNVTPDHDNTIISDSFNLIR